jgi:hypothetical protein
MPHALPGDFMKRLFLAVTLLTSSLSFAQSLMVLKTGKVLTFDDQGMIYDLGNFLLPYQIKELHGRYVVDDNRKLRTIDRNGFMFSKEDEDKVPVNIEVFGDNYFISKFGRIFTIDEQGFLFRAEEKESEFRKVEVKGGTFFTAEKKVDGKKFPAFYVVTALGKVVELTIPNVDITRINYTGGNYFTTTSGELFTVSADGYVYSKKDMGHFNGWELKRGGNYFLSRGNVFTVAHSGVLMNVAQAADIGPIKLFGTNFFVTLDGRLFTVSSNGTLKNLPFNEKLSNISHFSHL